MFRIFFPMLGTAPRGFKVLSTQPDLRIRYGYPIWLRILLLVFFLPFLAFFIGTQLPLLFKLLLGLNEILHMRFGLEMQVFAYNVRDSWSNLIDFFAYLAIGALFGAASLYMLWLVLGVTEIHAHYSSLAITYKLLGMSRKMLIAADDIQCFRQFLNQSGESNSWDLEIVSNERYFPEDQAAPAWFPEKWTRDSMTRMGCKKIHLYAYPSSRPSKWLGSVLADFYGVRFISAA